MTFRRLLQRSITHYWRTNLAVALGVGVAVSVLAGALVIGESMRASLRDQALGRLGRTGAVVTSTSFFREALAGAVSGSAPIIALDGAVTHTASRRRAERVRVYGVDRRFWEFHGRSVRPPEGRAALVSQALARELAARADDDLVLRVERPTAIPAGLLQGRRSDLTGSARVVVRAVLPREDMGEFSLALDQSDVRAVFVSLDRLQRDLDVPGRANTLLMATGSGADEARFVRAGATLDDLGLRLRTSPASVIVVEHASGVMSDPLVAAARAAAQKIGARATPALAYLANTIRAGEREIPYSLVAAVDLEAGLKPSATRLEPEDGVGAGLPPPHKASADRRSLGESSSPGEGGQPGPPPIWLNEWAASELVPRPGDPITLEYFLWSDEQGLTTSSAQFTYAGSLPMHGAGADPTLTPEYPGVTSEDSMADWDPPFPVDLNRVRARDEDYWKQYRAAPKAFVPLEIGQRLWSSPYGRVSSIRIARVTPGVISGREMTPGVLSEPTAAMAAFARELRAALDPLQVGLTIVPVRARALAAAQGTTDFGEYFLYFSFFVVAAGLLLASGFFRLSIEQRARDIGIFKALGFTDAGVTRLLVAEAALVAVAGSAIGAAGAVAYARLMVFALTTWWVDAVGTSDLAVHVTARSVLIGVVGGVGAAILTAVWVLRRGLSAASPRELIVAASLERRTEADDRGYARSRASASAARAGVGPRAQVKNAVTALPAALSAALSAGCVIGSLAGVLPQVPAFFAAGTLSLLAACLAFRWWLRRDRPDPIAGTGPLALARLGLRQASARPIRSVLSVALISAATFIIVAVGAFRRDTPGGGPARDSGTGGYALIAESVVPLMHDPDTDTGRAELGLTALGGARVARFRLRPGDDASCLNLYRPASPRVIAPTSAFVGEGRFRFARTIDRIDARETTDAERANPWLLLDRDLADEAVPMIGDANSMTYVFHVGIGDEVVLPRAEGPPVRLRLVATLDDSLFQSELIVGERHFRRLFPRLEGFRVFLVDVAEPARESEVAALLEDRLADAGLDVESAAARLAAYHRVENTYISTFQTLGALGVVLGTLGLGAVLLRNVLERRRELALLRAVGYRRAHLGALIVAETALLVFVGCGAGVACALLAIAPTLVERGRDMPVVELGVLVLAVAAAGLIGSVWATLVAARTPVISTLRVE